MLSKFCCQIPLADHHISGWKAILNFAAVKRDSVRDRSEFFFFLSLGTFGARLVGFEVARACDNGNSEPTCDHGARSAVQDNPSRNSGKEVHNSSVLDRLIGTCQE